MSTHTHKHHKHTHTHTTESQMPLHGYRQWWDAGVVMCLGQRAVTGSYMTDLP